MPVDDPTTRVPAPAADPETDPETAALAHDLRIACMRVARRVRFDADNTFAPHQFSVLVRLHEKPRTLGEVAGIEQVSAPTMSRTVSQLVDQGYVDRVEDPSDRRSVRLSLTEEGTQVYLRERAHRDAWMTARLEGLTAEDRELLRHATDLVNALVEGGERP